MREDIEHESYVAILTCPKCGKLDTHYTTHNANEWFRCIFCGKKFQPKKEEEE